MFSKLIAFMALVVLFSSSLFGEATYKYMGSFKAGESISGERVEQYGVSGLEYDFVVQEYGVVEFKPQEPTTDTVQYKITDTNKVSVSYFNISPAEGITSHADLDYPDGWKMAMMPGTYKIIVYTGYSENNPEKYYNMETTFTPSNIQNPVTGTTINETAIGTGLSHTPKPIILNETYHDNIAFYRNTLEYISSGYFIKNEMDYFSFSLTQESNVTIATKLNRDSTSDSLYFAIQKMDGRNYCKEFYASSIEETKSEVCTLDSGDYILKVGYTSVYNEYEFKLESTSATITEPACTEFSLEKNQQHVSLNVGDSNYFNISVCDPVQIFSSDDSIATTNRYKTEYVDEVKITAVSEGSVTVTVSDKNSVGYIYVDVGDIAPTTPSITTPDTKMLIGNITFLEYEPDGYFSWLEADTFCKERDYRLPTMEELIYVWNESGAIKSPLGFQKDTFYWASDIVAGSDEYKACAMDVDCSQEASWPSASYGHPKCVVSLNGSLIDTPTQPVTSTIQENDFLTRNCGNYATVSEGLKVNASSYRYGNVLGTKKVYDVKDSVTKMKWKANSSSYAQFSPQIISIASGNMTTSHSYAGSSVIQNDTWYYSTITVTGDKVSTVTSVNDYYQDGDNVIDSVEVTLNENQMKLSQNGVQIGFNMGDTYASTAAYFILSEFSTDAKVINQNILQEIKLDNELSSVFNTIEGDWKIIANKLQLKNANLLDTITLDISNASSLSFKAISKQDQSNFIVEAINKDGETISGLSIDPSTSNCQKEYYMPLTEDVVKVKFSFDTKWSIEKYDSQYKDVYIEDIVLHTNSLNQNISSYEVIEEQNSKKVNVDIDDKLVTITTPPNSYITPNKDKGLDIITNIDDLRVHTVINDNGTFMNDMEKVLNDIVENTNILIDFLVQSSVLNGDGSGLIKSVIGTLNLDFITSNDAMITPNYSVNGKVVLMPTFNSGSKVHVKNSVDDIIIEVQTKLTSKIVFQR